MHLKLIGRKRKKTVAQSLHIFLSPLKKEHSVLFNLQTITQKSKKYLPLGIIFRAVSSEREAERQDLLHGIVFRTKQSSLKNTCIASICV